MPIFGRSGGRRGGIKGRLVIALIIAGISLFSYLRSGQENPITGETQYVSLSPEQEIALGVGAAPQMAAKHGGLLPDREAQARIDRIGERLVSSSAVSRSGYRYEFHLLADSKAINAFALPGGQCFITHALASQLETDGEIAGVLGHEIGHVVARHGAQQMAKAKLTQGLTGAAVMATYDPNNPASRGSAAVAAMLGKFVNMKYGRDDEIESDRLGVEFMADAGYDPRSMIKVMEVLEAAGGGGRAEFFSTHPSPDRRVDRIKEAIARLFPEGVQPGLER